MLLMMLMLERDQNLCGTLEIIRNHSLLLAGDFTADAAILFGLAVVLISWGIPYHSRFLGKEGIFSYLEMAFHEISQRGVPDGHPIWYAPPTDPLKKIVQAQDRAVAEQVSLETAKTGYIEKVYEEPESRGTVVKSHFRSI